MSLQDPIADMLVRIKNAQAVNKPTVSMPHSAAKEAIATVLQAEGYITGYEVEINDSRKSLILVLKYFQGKPVIETLERVSRPGLRVYKGKDELPKIMSGLGISIISTSKGVMSDRAARKAGFGGEIVCYVS
jgi:small subunit ribosomal protein S8